MKKYLLGVMVALIIIPTALGYDSYVENKNYKAGDQVINGSKIYECLSAPNSEWCREGGYYIPGVGKYWRSAWKEIGELTNTNYYNTYNGLYGYTSNSDVIATSWVPTKTYRTITKKATTPGRPSISVVGKSYYDGDYTLNWTIPVDGKLGDLVQLYENGKLISEKSIDPKSAAKGGSFIIRNQYRGTFKYNVVMCLKKVCSSSGNMNITVYNGGSSSNSNEVIYTSTYNLPIDIQRVITSATPLNGTPSVDSVSTSNNRENVKRVMTILSEEKWDNLFPVADGIYSYRDFLKAVAKYPKFCGEVGENSGSDADTVCRKELATLLSFYSYESGIHSTNLYIPGNNGSYALWRQGLYYTQIPGLNSVTGGSYFGRGAFLLEGQSTYKYLSLALYGDEETLLREPSRLSQDGYASLASGMWYYMTPRNQAPSMHDIVVGNWKPTYDEIRNGMEQGFGAVMQAFDTRLCDGSGNETSEAQSHIEYYKEFANALNVSQGSSLSCKNLPEFSPVSYPVVNYFWKKNSNGECTLSYTEDQYYVFKEGSYEACRQDKNISSNSSSSISYNPNSYYSNSTYTDYNKTYTNTTTLKSDTLSNTKTYSSSISSEIPVFKKIPAGVSFEDLSKQIETELKKDLKSGKVTKADIGESLNNFESWISYLSDKNETTGLTGTEKRSVLILMIMKDIYSKYN